VRVCMCVSVTPSETGGSCLSDNILLISLLILVLMILVLLECS